MPHSLEGLTPAGKRFVWEEEAVLELSRYFIQLEQKHLPLNTRYSVGFGKGTGKCKCAGEYWEENSTTDSHKEFFLYPTHDGDSVQILGTIAHLMAHAILGSHEHGRSFRKFIHAIGMEGRATAPVPGPRFTQFAEGFVAEFGEHPWGRLNSVGDLVKKRKGVAAMWFWPVPMAAETM